MSTHTPMLKDLVKIQLFRQFKASHFWLRVLLCKTTSLVMHSGSCGDGPPSTPSDVPLVCYEPISAEGCLCCLALPFSPDVLLKQQKNCWKHRWLSEFPHLGRWSRPGFDYIIEALGGLLRGCQKKWLLMFHMFCSSNAASLDQNHQLQMLIEGKEQLDFFWCDTEHMLRHLDDDLWLISWWGTLV